MKFFFLFCPSLFVWVLVVLFYLANLEFSVKTFQCTLIFYDFSNDNVFRMIHFVRNVYFALKRRFSMFIEYLYLIALFYWSGIIILYFILTFI